MADNNATFNLSKQFVHKYISTDDVNKVVKCAIGPNAKIINCSVQPYSQERVGFLGSHWNLQVIVKPEKLSNKETHSFFVKCIPHDSVTDVNIINETRCFKKETTFYRDIMPELTKEFKGNLWCPKCYLVKDDMLIFEDLKPQNYKMINGLFDDVTTLTSALKTLARFHAALTIAEKRMGKSFYDIYPDLFIEGVFKRDGIFGMWYKASINVTIAVAKSLGCDDRDKIENYLDQVFELIKPSQTRRNTICHSDLWANNIMLNDETPPKCKILDFQLLRYIPEAADLAQIMYLNTDSEFRDKSERRMIEIYHRTLCKTVQKNKVDVKLASLEELLNEYEEYRCYGLSIASMYTPGICIENKIRTVLSEDPEAYNDFLYADRAGILMKLMEKDSFYKGLVTKVVKEVIKRSETFKKM